MLKDNNKSLKMPVIALDPTNNCCQSTLKYVTHSILSILTQCKLPNAKSNVACHKLLFSLGNNEKWHLYSLAVWKCWQKHTSFYSRILILQKTLKPITLLMDLERKVLSKHVLRQNWKAVSLYTNNSNRFFPKNVFFIYIYACTHTTEKFRNHEFSDDNSFK